jgi:hypothetical protein
MADKTNNIIYRIEVDSKSGKLNIDGVTKSFEQADKAFLKLQKDVAKGIPNATKSVKNLGDATGSATSATMELSRVISDMPYGIRGMANNITQLVSQLGTASTKAGGLTNALKLMWAQMMGPLGIVFAITAVVSALDFFWGAQKKVEESTEDATNQITKQVKEIQKLQRVTKTYYEFIGEALSSIKSDGTVFKEELFSIQDVVKILSKDFSEFKNGIDSLSEQDKKDPKKLENLIKSFQSLLKYREDLDGLEKRLDKFRELQKNNIKSFQEEEGGALIDVGKKVSSLTFEYVNLQRAILGLESLFEKNDSEDKTKKLSPFKTPKELEIDIKNADNAIIQYEKKIEDARLKKELNDKLSEATSEEEKAKIRRNYEKDRLINQMNAEEDILNIKKSAEEAVVKTKTKNHVDELKRKYTEFITELDYKKKLEKISEEDAKRLKGDATGKLFESLAQADTEEKVSLEEITEKYKPIFALFNNLKSARLEALFSFPTKDDGKKSKQQENLEKQMFYAEQFMMVQQSLTDFLGGEFDRQLTMEQNKTNAMNNELRERLNNENLSAGERKSIQLQIARNDEALRKKQEKIEKKRFKMQKAANISQALISTYLAAAQVQANPLLIDPVTKSIAMAATITSGLLNVATIARQKFQSSAGATVPAGALGGGGSGGADRSFNFNLAGASQENQLAQALQGQFDQPIQAYVVSRDITNQQQLDQDILTNASFG